MRLKLDNLIYTTDNPVKIEQLKELGAVEVEDFEEKKPSARAKKDA